MSDTLPLRTAKPPGKRGAEKLTPEEQRRRFEESARDAEASDDGTQFGMYPTQIKRANQEA